jgi:hypothetical protein
MENSVSTRRVTVAREERTRVATPVDVTNRYGFHLAEKFR